jgi:tetratricopeptide (TPR) repeat protein
MTWNEPYLMQYAFRFGAEQREAEARLGFPRADEEHPGEWVCSFQLHGLDDDRIRAARADDGLQALVIASDAIRKSLDQLDNIKSDLAPYEIVFPRYLPFCCGLDFHRKLCGIVDAEVAKKKEAKRRLALRKQRTAIKSPKSFKDVMLWIDYLRRDLGLPLGLVIDIVAERMRQSDRKDHYDWAWNLECLLREAERYSEAVQLLDEMIEQYPDNVRPLISKAFLYLYYLENPNEALKWIDVALERAYRTGFFRREALGNKARILLKLGRGQQLTQVLEEIMSMQMVKGVPDIGRERDFVDRAPPGMIPDDVLARYNQFRPKQTGDTAADEPPEWEPPEWE